MQPKLSIFIFLKMVLRYHRALGYYDTVVRMIIYLIEIVSILTKVPYEIKNKIR